MQSGVYRFVLGGALAWGMWGGGSFAHAAAEDEAGVDWAVPEIPDVCEVPPSVSRARSVARSAALEMGATEEQAGQAAFAVPENLDEWKSPLQLAFEEHAGEKPTDGDPLAPAIRVSRAKVAPRAAPKACGQMPLFAPWAAPPGRSSARTASAPALPPTAAGRCAPFTPA